MCGIAGYIQLNKAGVEINQLKQMTDAIAHRGPDGEGYWVNRTNNVGMGHRRLSVIDLSEAASQPMHIMDRYHIVYNGEIYNYLELKSELEKLGYIFTTKSDTEVLLTMYAHYKEGCLEKLDGMFSFLIYDEQEQTIFAAVDRFGEKPFFYNYIPGKRFLFASEMKALWAFGVPKTISKKMLFNFLSYGYVLNSSDLSETFYKECTRLPHSHYLKLNLNDLSLVLKKYYDINRQPDEVISETAAKEKVRSLLYKSVYQRLKSDVPIGSSLSGGLDSSIIVCIIDELLKNERSNREAIQTFSALFPGFKKDESMYVDALQQDRNLHTHTISPNANDFVDNLTRLAYFQEEPFGDAGIYLQYEIMRAAKNSKVTVLLDGQGADEVFAGYPHYFPIYFRMLDKTDKQKSRKAYFEYLNLHSPNKPSKLYKRDIEFYLRSKFENRIHYAKKLKLDVEQMTHPIFNSDFYYAYKDSGFKENIIPSNSLPDATYKQTFCGDLQMRLRFSDRNSMAHGREVRLPFLSHELVDFLFSLPANLKIQKGWTKYILRESFKSELPPLIANRIDKIAYEAPQENWFSHPKVKEKIKSAENALIEDKLLHPKYNNAKQGNSRSFNMNWKVLMTAMITE